MTTRTVPTAAAAASATKDKLLRGLHAALVDGSLATFTPAALDAIATSIFAHVTAEARTLERSAVTALPARLLVLSRKDLCDALAYGLARRVCDANAIATSADAFAAAGRGPGVLLAVLADVAKCWVADPAVSTLFQPLFLFKGFQAVLAYRIAHALWADGDEGAALLLQSRASELFAVDIHPTATLGAGVMLDHGTGVVIGSTAVIGDDVYMLHGVTLGATGKPVPRGSKRHPTLGRGCTVGANATVLGDIVVGDGATVGAGATVTKAVPPASTVVGVNSVRGAAPRAKL